MSIPPDVSEFLENYPGKVNDISACANFEFYSNTRRCRPDNRLIDEIHDEWMGEYDLLEYKHGYIQWLFPIQEHGMNFASQSLQRHEIESMKSNPAILDRIVISYKMMLDFYGMRLISLDSGLVDRSLPPRNYASRYKNLVRSSHNNLRISRILKCLSEFGFEQLTVGFLLHVLWEQSESHELDSPGIRGSMDRWWANCLRDEERRRRVGDLVRKVREGEVFTREAYEDEIRVRTAADSIGMSKDVVEEASGVAGAKENAIDGV